MRRFQVSKQLISDSDCLANSDFGTISDEYLKEGLIQLNSQNLQHSGDQYWS